ncbi:MAG: hypothetical protein IJ570_07375 [Prevotella sp.]|nr:hypothetical protein [Prevotella sp.]
MKKTMIETSKKEYQKPSMKVYQMKTEGALLTGSEMQVNIFLEDEEPWPTEPGTGLPFMPW